MTIMTPCVETRSHQSLPTLMSLPSAGSGRATSILRGTERSVLTGDRAVSTVSSTKPLSALSQRACPLTTSATTVTQSAAVVGPASTGVAGTRRTCRSSPLSRTSQTGRAFLAHADTGMMCLSASGTSVGTGRAERASVLLGQRTAARMECRNAGQRSHSSGCLS